MENIVQMVQHVVEAGNISEEQEEQFAQKIGYRERGLKTALNNMEIPFENKIKFCLIEVNSGKNKMLTKELVPVYVYEMIRGNRKNLYESLLKDKDFQDILVEYYKKSNGSIPEECLEQILSLPEFKKKILSNEDFVSQNSKKFNFFKTLPKGFEHLISLYGEGTRTDKFNIEQLYDKYFNDVLTRQEQLELANLQYESCIDESIVALGQKDKMRDITYTLKQILKDESFYKNLKCIQGKMELDLKLALSFAHKYSKPSYKEEHISYSSLYQEILDIDKKDVDDELKEKVRKLAEMDEIENSKTIERLSNLREYSIEQLENLPKRRVGINFQGIGGPTSTKRRNRIFWRKVRS